jgi:hypothetical protein
LVPFEAANFGVVPLTSKIDAWEDYLKLDYWIELYSIDKNVETILKLRDSAKDRSLQISRFVEWSKKNDWEYLSNKCLLHFAKTILNSRQTNAVSSNRRTSIKNLIKRSKMFPILFPIWTKMRYG